MTDAIVVIGLNHDSAPLEVRERFVFGPSHAEETLVALTTGGAAEEAVLLSTCNRTELYARLGGEEPGERALEAVLAARAAMDVAEARSYLYVHRGEAAVRHLFRVSSSLDSMIVGEAQIQGQVRDAYTLATDVRAARVVGPVLSRLFETALSVGGQVRDRTALGTGAASVPSAAIELAKKIFGPLKGHRALVLGAGEMSELAAQCLAAERVENVVVANRSAARAARVAATVEGTSSGYADLSKLLPEADIVVSATAAPHHMLTRRLMDAVFPAGREHPLLIVDLALPRDVEPVIGEMDGVFLYDIDDLRQIVDENRARRESEIPAAEALVAEAAAEFAHWYRSLDVVPVIRAMRDRADRLRAAELEKALHKLAHLSDADRAVVEALATQLVNKLLHEPTVRLREGSGNGHPVVAEAVRYLFDLDEPLDPTESETE